MSPFTFKAVGKNIRKWRLVHNISQEDMAEKLGITVATLSRLENDKAIINTHTFQKLIEYTNLDPNYFCYDSSLADELFEIHIHKTQLQAFFALLENCIPLKKILTNKGETNAY